MNRLPVTVLSGFLGAGKTTLRNHIFNNCLLTKAEFASGPEASAAYSDPFPPIAVNDTLDISKVSA